jgi:hypothetical protein
MRMANHRALDRSNRVLDKSLLRESVAALQTRLGLSHNPSATGQFAQAVTLASGIKPEERVLSSEIIRARQDERE